MGFLIVYFTRKPLNLKSFITSTLLICISGYLLLTAPISYSNHEVLRGVFLLATELTPYVLWAFAFLLVTDSFKLKNLPKVIGFGLGLYFYWLVYFFGIQLGKGVFHQVSNVIAIALVIHVIYLVLKDWHDDLVDSRRKLRVILISYIGFYAAVLATLEIFNAHWKDSIGFSLANAIIVFISVSLIGGAIVRSNADKSTVVENTADDFPKENTSSSIPLVFKSAYQSLNELMDAGFYTKTSLTITDLAAELGVPEHQLRELINKHLGYRNFSSFLNSYRLPAAKEQLADITKARIPILTIALDLGYGSISPFNRAFKAEYEQTPREFRQSVLK